MAQKNHYTSAELQKWLIEKALETTDPRIARKILLATDQRGRSTAMLGKLYFYKYNPLYGYKMTKYDKFPMCIPIERYHNGFLGLNLHYLSVPSRSSLLDILLTYKNEQTYTNATTLKINYRTLLTSNSLEILSKPCIHRYLWSQCRSRFIQIYPAEFDKAIQLPTEDWVWNQ